MKTSKLSVLIVALAMIGLCDCAQAVFAVLREIGHQGPITIKSPASFPAPDFGARAIKSLAFFRQVATQHAPAPGAKRAGE